MKLIGITGWSGAGKTTLIIQLIPILRAQGYLVSTVKHAHHAFDIDQPGKDSHQHRLAGASEVLISSGRRFALVRELREEKEWTLPQLLGKLTDVDIVLVEGFKREKHPKIEVYRKENGKTLLHPDDASICAVVADCDLANAGRPVIAIDDIDAVAAAVLRYARPIAEIFPEAV